MTAPDRLKSSVAVDSVCVEVRENLQCANVLMQFADDILDLNLLRLDVIGGKIRCKTISQTYVILIKSQLNIKESSISNLIAEKRNISFRVGIQRPNPSVKISVEVVRKTPDKTFVNSKGRISIYCNNCSLCLVKECNFSKIYPYPSGDISELFCHHNPNFNDLLIPCTTDLFYGINFIILNANTLRGFTFANSISIHCNRCTKVLGKPTLDGKAWKLWKDMLRVRDKNEVTISTLNFDSHIQLIQDILKETNICFEPLGNMQQSKILLYSIFANGTKKSLLLHTLETNLKVLKNNPNASVNSEDKEVQQIEVENLICVKLKYQVFELRGQDAPIPPMLAYWEQLSVYTLEISSHLFDTLFDELAKNSLLFPEIYRFSNDRFILSYIFSKFTT